MTKEALAQKKYRQSANGKAAIKRYNNSAKAKAAQIRYRRTDKFRICMREFKKRYIIQLRKRVINLYTNGSNVCVLCGKPIKNIHHTNIGDGRYEKEKFGTNANIGARLFQLNQYKYNPNYVRPLCNDCHIEEHKRIRKNPELPDKTFTYADMLSMNSNLKA